MTRYSDTPRYSAPRPEPALLASVPIAFDVVPEWIARAARASLTQTFGGDIAMNAALLLAQTAIPCDRVTIARLLNRDWAEDSPQLRGSAYRATPCGTGVFALMDSRSDPGHPGVNAWIALWSEEQREALRAHVGRQVTKLAPYAHRTLYEARVALHAKEIIRQRGAE